MEVFHALVNGDLSDEYLVENFEKVFALQELMTSAQILGQNANRDDVARPVTLSEDAVQKLKLMEMHSNESDVIAQRIKMIANANYEHLNLSYLFTCDDRTYEKLNNYLGTELDDEERMALGRSEAQNDIEKTASWYRMQVRGVRQMHLMEAVGNEFGENKEQATIKFVSNSGETMQTPYTLKGDFKSLVVARNLQEGCVLVTDPDGQAACYHVGVTGKVAKITAKDMLSDLAPEAKNALVAMERANRGLFIGSKEYNDALKAQRNLDKLMETSPKPLAGDENLKEQYIKTMAACKAYLDKKNPEDNSFEEIPFKNDRERQRYEAMQKAYDSCKRGLAKIDLQKDAIDAELKFVLGGKEK